MAANRHTLANDKVEAGLLLHNNVVLVQCNISTWNEGGVRVYGDAVLRYFCCGFAKIFILTCGIVVL